MTLSDASKTPFLCFPKVHPLPYALWKPLARQKGCQCRGSLLEGSEYAPSEYDP